MDIQPKPPLELFDFQVEMIRRLNDAAPQSVILRTPVDCSHGTCTWQMLAVLWANHHREPAP